MAPTCDQSFEGSKGESGPVVQYRAFGDSIPSGNKGSSSNRTSYGSYVNFFAADAAEANGWRVQYKTKTVAGETTPAINNTMNESAQRAMLAEAAIITFNGGGNDFLDAQAAFKSNCNRDTLVSAINSWKNSWDDVIATVRTYANPDAMIRTMTIYYPHPNEDRNATCSGEPVFDVLLPLGLAASHYMCATAEDEGWRCADALRAINCPTDDPRCPDMEWLYNLEAGVNTLGGNSCPRVNGGMMDHQCIRDYLEITGDAAFVQDTSNSLLQSGDIHPNEAGHNAIADAHHALGYDDCAACPDPPVPPACGDGTCNAVENASICPEDCPDSCGDGFCTGAENASCSDCPSFCGDDLCTGDENASNCGDCPDTCGDGYCTGSENATCGDCPAVCGDDLCTGAEDCNSCGGDCGECPAGSCNGIYYAATGTSSASFTDADTHQFDINMAAGTTYTITTCDSTSTDTYLRLHTKSGSQLVSNDDDSSCGNGRQSTISYTASSNGIRVLSLGCYSSNSCEATVSVSPDAECNELTPGSGGGNGGECAATSSCGGQAPSGCWCDSSCVNYGDCCSEVETDCQ